MLLYISQSRDLLYYLSYAFSNFPIATLPTKRGFCKLMSLYAIYIKSYKNFILDSQQFYDLLPFLVKLQHIMSNTRRIIKAKITDTHIHIFLFSLYPPLFSSPPLYTFCIGVVMILGTSSTFGSNSKTKYILFR